MYRSKRTQTLFQFHTANRVSYTTDCVPNNILFCVLERKQKSIKHQASNSREIHVNILFDSIFDGSVRCGAVCDIFVYWLVYLLKHFQSVYYHRQFVCIVAISKPRGLFAVVLENQNTTSDNYQLPIHNQSPNWRESVHLGNRINNFTTFFL